MGNMTVPALLGLMLSVSFVQPAYAGSILGTMSGSGGIVTVAPNSATNLSALIAIGPLDPFFPVCFVVGNCAQIALLQGIDSSAIGTEITIDSGAPAFNGIVSSLTNGLLDYICTGVVPGPSYGTSSGGAVCFGETSFGTSPDFVGDTIQSLILRIDNVTIRPSIVIPPGNEFRIDYTLTVFGTSPEPATCLTIGTGVFLLITRRRRAQVGRRENARGPTSRQGRRSYWGRLCR